MNWFLALFGAVEFWASSVRLSTSVLSAALGEVVAERAGVVNIGLEGMMLAGAMGSVLGTYYTGNPWVGLLIGMGAGALLALIAAVIMITLACDQVVTGAALTIAAVGATSLISRTVWHITDLPQVTPFVTLPVPLLSDIPILGHIFFRHIPIVYIALLAVPAAWFFLRYTEWGLRLRAVGEHPRAADSLGVNVARVRYGAMLVCGALAGLGGSFLSLGSLRMFVEAMTGGRGFIALAVVIVGRWDPWRTAVAALFFGMVEALTLRIQALGAPVPYQLVHMLPYVATLVLYGTVLGRAHMPRALARPYVKD